MRDFKYLESKNSSKLNSIRTFSFVDGISACIMARENFEGTNFRRSMMNRADGWLVLETDTADGDKLYWESRWSIGASIFKLVYYLPSSPVINAFPITWKLIEIDSPRCNDGPISLISADLSLDLRGC